MTERYEQEIKALAEWFEANISTFPALNLTAAEFQVGTDSLQDGYKAIVSYAFWKWLYERNYELSYNQDCRAFFQAAKNAGKLNVT